MKAASRFALAPIVIVATAVGASPPPIQTVTTPPPPAPVTIIAGPRGDQLGPPVTFAIAVLSGRTTVWSGTLRLAGRRSGNSNYSQTRNEAPALCASGEYRPANSNGIEERLNVRLERNAQEIETFSIRVDWTRSLPDCQGEGQSSVGISRPFRLEAGKSIELQGDGDFVVRLSRKD